MIPLSRFFVRAALLWLVAGLALRAATPLLPQPVASALEPVALHALVFGWLSQLAFGVAWWMFPRAPGSPATPDETLGWSCFGALNSGMFLRLWAEPATLLAPGPLTAAGRAASALLLFIAASAFVVSAWRRLGARPCPR